MKSEFISKGTRNGFRELLVSWTLREIDNEFENAGIRFDSKYTPSVTGQRRTRVEQHYRTLDFADLNHTKRLLTAYASIIDRVERELPNHFDSARLIGSLAQVKVSLERDGFKYQAGSITATRPATFAVFEEPRTVSEVTRRVILADLCTMNWSGGLQEPDFLRRVCDQANPKHASAIAGAWQHRVNNWDWDDDWLTNNTDLDLLGCSDEFLLRFLCEVVHPVVRPDSDEAFTLAAKFNRHLLVDGWEMVEGIAISQKPTFKTLRRVGGAVALPAPGHAADPLSDEYVRELSNKCDSRLAGGDLDGAVTVARTLLEKILHELELRLAGSANNYKGDLPKQFRAVAKLLRMDDQRPDLDDRFKDVIRGLVTIAHGLATLRNKISDGHARLARPAPHHARVVVNAAKTVATFLVESYNYQIGRGLLLDVSPSSEEVTT